MASGARYSAPRASGSSAVSRLGWPGRFVNFPEGRRGWGLRPGLPGAPARPAAVPACSTRLRGAAGTCFSLGPGGGGGGRPRWPGCGSGARRCTVLGGAHTRGPSGQRPPVRRRALGSVLGSSLSGHPRCVWGPATPARTERPVEPEALGTEQHEHVWGAQRNLQALGSQPPSVRSLGRAGRPALGWPRVRACGAEVASLQAF